MTSCDDQKNICKLLSMNATNPIEKKSAEECYRDAAYCEINNKGIVEETPETHTVIPDPMA